MPSFRAELEVDGATHPLNTLHFYSSRKRDPKGRPSSHTMWVVVVDIDIVEDSAITAWMVDKNAKKDATITFYNADDDSTLKKWELKQAICYTMNEKFISDLGFMRTVLKISGKEISNGDSTMKFEDK
ncbi:MAG: hypothetical protein H7Y12_07235 [Sphingobacteriaceae bacterium]|nr:hypothetical protein [Cytophagaceae bacterium]